MMKKLLFLFFNIVAINFAQEYELLGPPGALGGNNIISIYNTNPNIVYSVSHSGFFKTNDGGKTTLPVFTTLKELYVNSIRIISEDIILFGEYYFGYFLSNDSGKNWDLIISDPYSKKLVCLYPDNNRIILIKRNQNELWRSNDKGVNWFNMAKFDEEIVSFGISSTDTSIQYLATRSQLYKSADGGEIWDKKASLPGATDMQLNPADPDIIYIQTGGRLYKTTDGGETINIIFTPGVEVFKLSPSDTSIIYAGIGYTLEAGGYPSGIYKSTNGGTSWTRKMNGIDTITAGYGSPTRTIEINPKNSDEVYTEVYEKGVFKTTDGGENWIHTNLSFMPVSHLVIDKDVPETIVAGNRGWGIIKTNDGGKNWFYPHIEGEPEILPVKRSFDFNPINKMEGYLAGGRNLYKTTDSGDNWFSILSFSDYKVRTVYFHSYNSDIVFSHAEGGKLYISYGSGLTWSEHNYMFASNICFVKYDDNTVFDFINSNEWIVRKSTDLGKTWFTSNNGLLRNSETGKTEGITSLAPDVNNPDIVYCAQNGGLSKSTNGGDNWFRVDSTLQKLEPSLRITSILLDQENSNKLYIGVSAYGKPFTDEFTHGGLYLTEDECKTWRKVFEIDVKGIYSDDGKPRRIYLNTNYGVLKFLDTLTVTNIKLKEDIIADSFELFQNYPNPFNPTTRIDYQIPLESQVSIKVYNILGKELITLVDKRLSAGKHHADFLCGNLLSGVYIYSIRAGNYKQSRKMILLI